MNADADKKAKEEAEKINAADGMIFQTEKQLKEYGDKIPADKKANIEGALENLKKAHASRNLSDIDSATTALNSAWEAASQDMANAMNQQQANPQGDANANTNDNGDKGENVTDVDYEEVK